MGAGVYGGDVDGNRHMLVIAALGAVLVAGAQTEYIAAEAATIVAPSPTVTLTIPAAQQTGVTYATPVTLNGRVTAAGRAVRAAKVQLLILRYPFLGKYLPAVTTTTAARGSFSFTVHPQINTRYRAVLVTEPTVGSPALAVYAFANRTLAAPIVRGRLASAVFTAIAPTVIQLAGRAVSFYFARLPARLLTHVGDAFLHPTTRGHARAVRTIKLPVASKPYRFKVYACLHTIPGMGRPQPACGRATLPISVAG
jgi:hypothetical protein